VCVRARKLNCYKLVSRESDVRVIFSVQHTQAHTHTHTHTHTHAHTYTHAHTHTPFTAGLRRLNGTCE